MQAPPMGPIRRLRHPRRLAVLALATLLSGPSAHDAAAQPARADWLLPCTVNNVDGSALCGTREVWENRAAQTGRQIGIRVVVLPALGPDRLPDPIFYFAGGPGGSAISATAGIARTFATLRSQRDLVFVDLRGTGRSHPLRCPSPPDDAPLQTWFSEFLPDDEVRACKAGLDADPAFYSNISAMDDVNEIRMALGYDRINLYGGSGGTRSIQVYLKRHPTTARAAILKGVVPMDMENPLPHARSLEAAMAALLEACRAEPACGAAYPDLAADWRRSQEPFAKEGTVRATVRHPRTGRAETVTIGRGTYADGVRHILYTINASRRLPAMIHAAARGNYDHFAQLELEQSLGFAAALSMGAFLSATCAEDLRFVTEEDIRRATDGTFLGDYRARRQLAACAVWGSGEEVGASFQQPVDADVPVLLISGAHDAVTSPEGAERVARALPRAWHLVFPNQSHDTVNPECERRLMADFIRAAGGEGLDTRCVGETRRPPFLVELPGGGG